MPNADFRQMVVAGLMLAVLLAAMVFWAGWRRLTGVRREIGALKDEHERLHAYALARLDAQRHQAAAEDLRGAARADRLRQARESWLVAQRHREPDDLTTARIINDTVGLIERQIAEAEQETET